MARFIKISFLMILLIVMNSSLNLALDTPGSVQVVQPLQILNITPSGEDVPSGRQIVFMFNRPVVPVGRMDRTDSEITITITPEVKGQWRWLNTTSLARMLDEKSALSPATRYEIIVNPGIKAEDGSTIKETVKHGFITERPRAVHTWFKTWAAPGVPVIRMTFNQPVSQDSIEKYLFIRISGQTQSRIRVKAVPDPDDKETPIILPLPGENLALLVMPDSKGSGQDSEKSFFGKLLESLAESLGKVKSGGGLIPVQEKKEQSPDTQTGNTEARRVWLISPENELPDDISMQLIIEPGLVSALGPEKGVESRNLVSFDTFPEFAFKGIKCTDNGGNNVFLKPGETSYEQCLCNPMRSLRLVFSSPVINSEIKKSIKFNPVLSGSGTEYDPWDDLGDYSSLRSPHKRGQDYNIRLPGILKADQVYHVEGGPGLPDEFGRLLKYPISITFKTDHRLPDFALINPMSVLEKYTDTEMPVVVTNLYGMTLTFDRLTRKGKEDSLRQDLAMPGVMDLAVKIPAQVRKMLDGQSGVVQGTVTSFPYVSKHYTQYRFFAEVTPFQVHVKIGHFNSAVWVTDLQTGEPVSGAKVRIYKDTGINDDTYEGLSQDPEILTEGITDSDGAVLLAGTEKIDPDLTYAYVYDRYKSMLFVRVEKDEDMALLPLDYDFRADTYHASQYDIWPSKRTQYGHIHAWGTTAQGVYRAGDTIQYKFYVRDQDNERFVPPPKQGYTLKVVDPMGKTVHEVKDIVLSDFGAGEGEFTVPKTGAVGWYQFYLSASFTKLIWEPMRVLVSDFTPSPFKVTTDINGRNFQPDDEIRVTTQARLHGGGPYADASARITVTLKSMEFSSDDPSARGFLFDSYDPETPPEQMLHQKDGNVDEKGDLVTGFTLPESKILYGRLMTESAVRDDRGKYITGSTSAKYAARDRFVGLRSSSWILEADKPGTVDVLAVDAKGTPVAGIPVTVRIEHQVTTAARVKGPGNAYLTNFTHQWLESERQVIESASQPVSLRFTPGKTGSYRITAVIKDSKAREHSTQIFQWVIGKGAVIWEENENNSLEVIAEKNEYNVGETARYLVKNPFPGVKALVTIERYGVLKHWVQTLETATPVIECQVEKDYIPGYYLSVVAMSPRVDKPLGDDEVDLGRPAFRMGYVETAVSDPYKEIKVDVKPEKDTYKPGDRVKVDLHAAVRNNGSNEPVELAVAVLDEAVFDLIAGGKAYFDPYNGFYTIDGLDMDNFSLLMQLVGRQKFEKKGADPAGDGGVELGLRSVFKFVSYWNPSIKIDAQGNASIEFELPDNLTGWRILAMAVTPTDRMGLGEGHFAVNRPTEIRPVMPNQVIEGDGFQSGFSIMNRTDKTRELTVTITARGQIETEAGKEARQVTQTITAEPYKRTTIWLPLKTRGDGKIRFTARGGDASDQDGVVHELEVRKRASLETAATYGSSASGNITESLQFPEDIRTDVGNVSVTLSPTVIGNVEGAFGYLRDYPYICWEQRLTKGVMASHYQNLNRYMSDEFQWEGSKGLPQSTLDLASSYQAPSGGMAYYIPEDRYADPYLSAYTALAFNWLREGGYKIPSAVEDKLHEYLITMLRKDVAPDFYSRGMASTVRAVALAALAKNNKITIDDLRRYQPYVKEMDLFGKAHFLMAAINIEGAEDMRKEVFNMILSHADQTGGKFIFNEAFDDSYSRILTSSLRTNAAVMSALVAYGKTDEAKALVGDIPFRMVRYITQTRKQSGRWENTQENMFCMNALIDYSRAYESERPDMAITAMLDTMTIGKADFKDLRDKPAEFKRPIEKKDPGRKAALTLERQGPGRLYYSVGLSYAPKKLKADPINAGIDVRREYSVERDGKWILLRSPMNIKRGELVRVDLYVSLPAARNFVVVDDPVPGGLEPVNRDLATSSAVDAGKAESDSGHATDSWLFHYGEWSYYGISRWSFYHQELRHHAARFYSEYLPAGNYHLSYTAQAIASGEFAVMPTHAEEMYDPDVFGKGSPAMLNVKME
ncbi:MAG TPA: alpha-2-macroglobulin family protein [Desulfatiglandales bacterium]|nr:alpha-2-macroglobulin family protein [Desulfatiglandales bacterium]